MSAAPLAFAAMPPAGDSRGVGLRVAGDHERAVGAAWQSVFAQSHAGGWSAASATSVQPPRAMPDEARVAEPLLDDTGRAGCSPLRRLAPWDAAGTDAAGRLSGPAAISRSSVQGPANAVPSAPDAVPQGPGAARRDARPVSDSFETSLPAMPAPSCAELDRRPARDVVSVFVDGSAVTVVVRDSALSDDVALHTAREVSRRIAGHDGALRRLTLNGRLVYHPAPEGQAHPATSGTLFSC